MRFLRAIARSDVKEKIEIIWPISDFEFEPHKVKTLEDIAVNLGYLKQWALHCQGLQGDYPEGDEFSMIWTATLVPVTATNRDKVPTSLAALGSRFPHARQQKLRQH